MYHDLFSNSPIDISRGFFCHYKKCNQHPCTCVITHDFIYLRKCPRSGNVKSKKYTFKILIDIARLFSKKAVTTVSPVIYESTFSCITDSNRPFHSL